MKTSAFNELLDILTSASDGGSFRIRMVKAFSNIPTPRGISEGTMTADIYTDFAGHAIACEALYHIQNHGGESCVPELIKMRVATLYAGILETIEEGCTECSLENPLRGISLNEQTVADILAEISDS